VEHSSFLNPEVQIDFALLLAVHVDERPALLDCHPILLLLIQHVVLRCAF
jgi:hypothetical protein